MAADTGIRRLRDHPRPRWTQLAAAVHIVAVLAAWIEQLALFTTSGF
ncbi:hypothetical protein [Streptomyces sp. NPDC097981]